MFEVCSLYDRFIFCHKIFPGPNDANDEDLHEAGWSIDVERSRDRRFCDGNCARMDAALFDGRDSEHAKVLDFFSLRMSEANDSEIA